MPYALAFNVAWQNRHRAEPQPRTGLRIATAESATLRVRPSRKIGSSWPPNAARKLASTTAKKAQGGGICLLGIKLLQFRWNGSDVRNGRWYDCTIANLD